MITERLKQFIDSISISISAFEKSIGMSNASFRKIYNNNGAIGSDKLERILNTYPQLNPSWLLTGEGSMILGEEAAVQQNKFGKFIHVYIGRDAKDDKYVNVDHIVYIEKYSGHIRIITLKDSGFDVYKDYEEILRYLTSLSFSH